MNQLIEITNGAPKSVALALTEGLQRFFIDAEKEKAVIDSIVVTKPDQVKEMKKAREIRRKIKNSRLEARDIVKSHRENLKNAMAEYTLQDKLWLKAFKMLEATCDKLESDCEYKEKFAERYEAEQKQMRYELRAKKLLEYGTDPSIYSLFEMTDESFEKLLQNERLAFEARIKAEKEAEEKRIAEQEAERKRQEDIKKENERLKKEAEAREKQLAKERAEQQKILEAERKAREEVEKKARLEREAAAKKEAEEKARLEAIKRQEEEAQRAKLLAPDKEKLLSLAKDLDSFELPAVSSKEAQGVIRATQDMLGKMTNYIRDKAKAL